MVMVTKRDKGRMKGEVRAAFCGRRGKKSDDEQMMQSWPEVAGR